MFYIILYHKYMNKIKGDLYEIQIRDYVINNLDKPCYLWSHTPENLLIENGIIGSHNDSRLMRKQKCENKLPDTGVDAIQIEKDNNCSFIQCKNGYKRGVTMKDLAGFYGWIAALDKLDGYVYYTNKLSENVRCMPPNKRIHYVKQAFVDNAPKNDNNNFIVDQDKLVYQTVAKQSVIEHFKTNNRCIMTLPCGTGKTYISYLISQEYKQIVIISPLKQFAKQNLDRFVEYGYDGKTLLIDSDGERDEKIIKKFIQTNKEFIMSSTFCSIDVIYKCSKYMKDALFIVDEFHNLSKTNISDDDDDFYKLLSSNKRIMFMSATPRVYEVEDSDDDYNMEMFGKIVYKMSFSEAIEKKYITDYKIWLPSVSEDNSKLEKEISIYKIDKVIQTKCMFLFSCMLNNGSRKCIIYCENVADIELMKSAINKLNEFYYLDIEMNKITADDSACNRTDRLKYFEKSKKIQLLFGVRILDEAIDIPSCDSIFITYPTKSKIRTIQRLCRCIRTDKNNKFKIGNVFLWCDEYNDILEILSGIKEYDELFKDKINVNENNFYKERKVGDFKVDEELVKKYVVGTKEYKQLTRIDTLNKIKLYIDTYKKGHHQKAKILI